MASGTSRLDRRADRAAAQSYPRIARAALGRVLEEAKASERFDFLSIDVEGHEIEMLRGFDIVRWQPRLIPLEDHVDLSKRRFLKAACYRIVRRYECNGWYVPRATAVRMWPGDIWEIVRKYYLALPFRWPAAQFLAALARQLVLLARDLVRPSFAPEAGFAKAGNRFPPPIKSGAGFFGIMRPARA